MGPTLLAVFPWFHQHGAHIVMHVGLQLGVLGVGGAAGGLSVCPHWFINVHTGRRGVDEGGGVFSAVKCKQWK